jgi:hypothetical protein
MMDNKDFNGSSTNQFVISYELMCLLRWLIENESEKIQKIVSKSVAEGLQEELQKIDTMSDLSIVAEGVQEHIIEFLSMLETFLFEAINKEVEKTAREKKLMPAIEKIDTNVCDNEIVRSSIEKTTKTLSLNPDINPKEQLFKEILKRWKPHNKNLN